MGRLSSFAAIAACYPVASASVLPRQGSTAPPYPGTDYPGASDANAVPGAQSNQQSPPSYPSPWGEGLGDWSAAYVRARQFVGQLTLLEKVNLTTGVGWEGEACVGNVGSIPRLGFQSLCMQDSPLGVRNADYVSAFPAGGTVAQSWDRQVWYDRGLAMGMEHRGKGVDVQLGPVVGPIGRSPEGGRNWEGFSPDPVLSGIAVAETIKGIQAAGVVACTKHLIGNEQEHFRQQPEAVGYGYNITEALSSNIDDTTMHELYLWPFADAIRAGTGSIMCSYNQINNSYGCQNSYLLNHLVKNELGFQGFIMSDWQAQHAGVSTSLSGMDMSMPGDTIFDSGKSYWGANLTLSVINGTVPEWRLDDMAVRIMAAYYYVGRDKQVRPVNFNSWTTDTYGYRHAYAKEDYGLVNQHVDVRDGHGGQIRNFAARSNILLKNTNKALPLTGKEKFTAVFGEDADTNVWGPNGCSDRGCDNGTLAMGWGSGTANFPYLVSPLTAIQNKVLTNYGRIESVTDNWAYSQIAALASQASTAIVFVNSDSGEGYISVDGNEGDRNNLTLWRNGETLISNVTAKCNNTIVVIHSVGPVLIDSWHNNPNVTAIIWAGLPGEQSGNSLVDVLYGYVNPGGKLPFTLGATRDSYGTDVLYEPNNGMNAPQDNFVEGNFIDYRHFDKAGLTPVYEFGYGLSYTTFSYSGLNIKAAANVPAYTPGSGMTPAAPQIGNSSRNTADYQFPAGFHQVPYYIYPNLNSTNAQAASQDTNYGVGGTSWLPANAQNGNPQPVLPAGGAPGGNPGLYDILFTVTATITNTGSVAGDEVAQLYISLGGPNDPVRVLRGFDKLAIAAGATATFKVDLTRRDLSNWDTVAQNWFISSYAKQVFVGSSSRNLKLNGTLNTASYASAGGMGSSAGGGAAASNTASGGKVTQISDGQVQAPTGKVSQISDGQVQVPTGSVKSATATASGKVSQLSDGQVQAPTGAKVSQISDGQIQAPTAKATPLSQISDGQIQAPVPKATPVSQVSDGQVQAPKVTTTQAAVSQMADGQPIASTK